MHVLEQRPVQSRSHCNGYRDFDKLSQTKMPRWTPRRVAFVGDAAYCTSPAAGVGGSLATIGATALFDAFQASHGDVDAAFTRYERDLRPPSRRDPGQYRGVRSAHLLPRNGAGHLRPERAPRRRLKQPRRGRMATIDDTARHA